MTAEWLLHRDHDCAAEGCPPLSGGPAVNRDDAVTAALFFVDTVTGERCPQRGSLLCTVTDRDHRHRDGRVNRDDAVTAVAEALRDDGWMCDPYGHEDGPQSPGACSACDELLATSAATAVAALEPYIAARIAAETEALRREVERLRELCDDDLRRHRVGRAAVDALTAERDEARAALAEDRERLAEIRTDMQRLLPFAGEVWLALARDLFRMAAGGFAAREAVGRVGALKGTLCPDCVDGRVVHVSAVTRAITGDQP
jgi:hypothetical protein